MAAVKLNTQQSVATQAWPAASVAYAGKMANTTTGLEQYQWLAIKAACESLAAAQLPGTFKVPGNSTNQNGATK